MSNYGASDILIRRLADIRSMGLERRLVPIKSFEGTWVMVEGRRLLLMAGNDYLGLTGHPRLKEAALRAVEAFGTGTGSSRLICGTHCIHSIIEEEIARFARSEAALFFNTGYMANLGAVTGLARPGDYIVSDEFNHASIIDACRLSRAAVKVYPHRDAEAALDLLSKAPRDCLKLLVTEGVFSMDGDEAPLPDLLEAARIHKAILMVDDAHAVGVRGPGGRGTWEEMGLSPCPEMVLIGTFSKALGGTGGFVAACSEVINSLVNNARPFIYTTAPPPSQVAAARESLRVIGEEPERRERLEALCGHFRERLMEEGFETTSASGPIIPILIGDAGDALAMAAALLENGVLAPAVRPPTVPKGSSRLRLTVTASHRIEELDQAVEALCLAREAMECQRHQAYL